MMFTQLGHFLAQCCHKAAHDSVQAASCLPLPARLDSATLTSVSVIFGSSMFSSLTEKNPKKLNSYSVNVQRRHMEPLTQRGGRVSEHHQETETYILTTNSAFWSRLIIAETSDQQMFRHEIPISLNSI